MQDAPMIKFPSIDQYRNAIKAVQMRATYVGKDEEGKAKYDFSKTLPTLEFRGTVKLHGTNAAIVLHNGNVHYQSRERVLTLQQDNAGFMLYMAGVEANYAAVSGLIADILNAANAHTDDNPTLAIYGEWCGEGIQRGVAISKLPKMFVVFAACLVAEDDMHQWIDLEGVDFANSFARIFNIFDYGVQRINIDFNKPELAQNEFIALTEAVEAKCPVGAAMGADGIGEGVVWSAMAPEWRDILFKVKGEKHSATHVKTLAAVDIEAMNSIREFVESVTTEARLEQGLHVLQTEMLKPFEMTSMGDFLRWAFNDIIKEENDTIVANGLDVKKLGGQIATVARKWFIERYNAQPVTPP